ncbi:DUF4046 domain-containing protein [Bacillus toyonensis]|uniref:DUF4046 domain-containing protein n=1 Tax=Bacillus toyonensis TaxID=155322 RepID=UPI00124F539E|nr:DUF4046 domain-containing protein [Bacillus toyonensis]KAB2354016.1 DUF4046 domain-containing protein [Bacillus toyonensis]
MKQTIVEIYEEILSGKRRFFPKGTWKEDTQREIIKLLTRHLVNDILKWNEKEIKDNWNLELIKKWKLGGACSICFKDSPYQMLDAAFPGQFKPWDLRVAPNKTWMNKREAITIIRNEIETSSISISELHRIGVKKWMIEKKMITPFSKFWKDSPVKMLAELYPENIKNIKQLI